MSASSGFEAIVFDFDGVLVESADVKTRAFAALYATYGPEIERQVIEYHLMNAGISRYRKFQHYQEALLGIPYTDADGERLSEQFSRQVVDVIVGAPYVAGAHEVLQHFFGRLPMFVASGTPDGELHEIVERRGMSKYFVSVHGTPETKAEILARLIRNHGFSASHVLMVGDAIADLEGAKTAGAAFLGRTVDGHNPFPAGIETIPDLTSLAAHLCR